MLHSSSKFSCAIFPNLVYVFDKEPKKLHQSGSVLTSMILLVTGVIGSATTLYHVVVDKIIPSTPIQEQILVTPSPFPKLDTEPIQPVQLKTDSFLNNDSTNMTDYTDSGLIKCLGADRKYSYVTANTCEVTRKYWTKVLGSYPTDPEEIMECQGADGRYSNVSRKVCEDTNKFWSTNSPPSTGNSSNTSSSSSSSSSSSDITAPSIPGTPSITTSDSATPTWTWTASTDSGSGIANPAYTIQWSQDSGFASGVTSSTSNTNSYTHLSALGNGTWYFRVSSTDVAGNTSSYSSNGLATVFPQNLLTNSGTEFEGFDTFAQWTQNAGTIINDAINFRAGTASLKLTTGVGTSATATKTISTNFGTAPRLRISFYLAETYNDLSNVQIRLSSQSSFATVKYASPGRGTGFHSGWNTTDIYPSDWQDIGGESWSNTMIRLRIQVIPVSGRTANVSVDTLVRDVAGYPAIIISFDDGFSDAYSNAYTNMQSRNLKGTAFIITNTIGNGGNVTSTELQEMFTAGWTIGNHTSDHTSLSGVAEATQETKIGDAKTALANLGITTGDHLALPYGSWDENTLTAARNLGIKTNRTVQDSAYPLVHSDQMLLESSHVPTNVTTLAAVEAWVDEATTKNTPVWFQFHQIVNSPASTYQWSTANFQSLLDYLLTNGIRTLTVDEFYRLNSNPITVGHL